MTDRPRGSVVAAPRQGRRRGGAGPGASGPARRGGIDVDAPAGVARPVTREVPAEALPSPWSAVPWRTMVTSAGIIVFTLLLVKTVFLAKRVLLLTLLAGFFAVVLARPVAAVERKSGLRRAAAVSIVMLTFLAVLGGLLTLFVVPVRGQVQAAVRDLPGTVHQAAEGRGPVGQIVTKLRVEQLVRENETTLADAAASVQRSLPRLLGSAIEVVVLLLTVVVMVFLMLTQSTSLSVRSLELVPPRHRERVRVICRDAAGAASGYMIGNLLISLCAGVAAFAILIALRVPNALLISLWVAFADLIPLVGATFGALVAVIAAFLVSTTAGVVAIVCFVAYQQFENSVLQIVIMARTVHVNPLAVLLSMLLGVELLGVVGALLSVPFAGAFAVIAKAAWPRPPEPVEPVEPVEESAAFGGLRRVVGGSARDT